MICGNETAQSILNLYFDNIEKGIIPYNFILLEWPANIWKTTLIKQLSEKLLWNNYKTDFLYLADLSSYLWKNHTIKIQVDANEQYIKIDWVGNFLDLGSRDIIEWLYKSSLWKYKILLLENIERMTPSAANAFLKTFEEPLKNRLIFATTQNKTGLLDTITSRAFSVKFEIPNYNLTKQVLKERYPTIDEKTIDLVISFAMWRIGFAIKLLDGWTESWTDNFNDIINQFERFIKIFDKEWMLHEKMQILTNINKNWMLNIFFDAVIFYYSRTNRFDLITKIFNTKKYIWANVWAENSLFEMIL